LPVPGSGYITYPFLGQIRVEGLSEVALGEEITRGLLDGYLLQPQVSVAVISYRPIYVGGAVRLPGQKDFSIGMDVERLIALAGGVSEHADLTDITIQRRGENGQLELNATLAQDVHPGDVVTVGEMKPVEQVVEYIYLQGEVRKPGRYEYGSGLTVEKAVAIAGGFGLRASRRKISVSRGEGAEDLERVPLDTQLQPGDVITVGASLF
jgi:polysaccharide export outer membrane protein